LQIVAVEHKFLNHVVDAQTETLIIGTFNPDTEKNDANFFYSRKHNFLWRLLPKVFEMPDMRDQTKLEKEKFAKDRHIDFIDIISKVCVEQGKEANFSDAYIDSRVDQFGWTNVAGVVEKLNVLKRVCFTRRSFSNVPNIRHHVAILKELFEQRETLFRCIISPARFYSERKQIEWNMFFRQ